MAVKCSVVHCHYGSSGNHYPTPQILVAPNQVGSTTDDNFDLIQADQLNRKSN